jgi:hypothetical protein
VSEIHEFMTVDVPFERVPVLAERFLAAQQQDAGEAIVPLRLQVADLTIERDVRLTIVPARRYPGYEVMEIRWHAEHGAPYPTFRGTLSAEQGGTTYCRLELDGGYEPPGNVAGAAFDAVIGKHIAEAVARTLLEHLKTAFETEHAAEAKAS